MTHPPSNLLNFVLLSHCFEGLHVDILAAFLTGGEEHYTVNESKESMVFAHTYIKPGVMLSATLTLDDIAGFAFAAAENFNTKSFAF